jgi:hypothetical protein
MAYERERQVSCEDKHQMIEVPQGSLLEQLPHGVTHDANGMGGITGNVSASAQLADGWICT